MVEPAKRFHYPPVDEYTGLVQFAIDRHETAQIKAGDRAYGTVRRGEVVKMKEALAKRLVTRGGNFSHVATGTAEGQPAEYKMAQAKAPAEPDPLSVRIRASMRGRTDLSTAAQRRLHELADAAESSEQIGADATTEIKAGTVILRAGILEEWRALIAQPEAPKE